MVTMGSVVTVLTEDVVIVVILPRKTEAVGQIRFKVI